MTTTAVMRKQLFINGEWRDAAGGQTIAVVNPATEEVIAEVASADASDVDAAVTAARAAFDGPWAKLSARERGKLVWKIGERLMERADEIARLVQSRNRPVLIEIISTEIPEIIRAAHHHTRPFGNFFPETGWRCFRVMLQKPDESDHRPKLTHAMPFRCARI